MNTLTLSGCTAGKLLVVSVKLVISTHSLGYFYDIYIDIYIYIYIILINHNVVFKYYRQMRLYMSTCYINVMLL